MKPMNRRKFLSKSGAGLVSASAAMAGLAGSKSWAMNTGNYKALVCIFLKGGLDHADTVLPVDQASYDQLQTVRPGLLSNYQNGPAQGSRARQNLLRLNPANAGQFGARRFGLPSQLAGMRRMFEDGDLAIVGNVGPLIEPTDRATFRNGAALPARLFSHNDQQSTWMSLAAEGARVGWGGQFIDTAIRNDSGINPLYAAVTTSELDVFLAGEETRQFSAGTGSSRRDLNIISVDYVLGSAPRREPLRQAVFEFFDRGSFGHQSLMKRDYAMISSDGVRNVRAFSDAAIDQNLNFPETPIGFQLKTIANAMAANNALGTARQVFYATMGGFDTHSEQSRRLPNLQTQLSEALLAFRNGLQLLGLWDSAVVFTGADFGRALIDNGDGTDHGWGGHHFVMGGEVAGNRIYGDIPAPDQDGPQYTPRNPRLIPTVSIEQYASTLGAWFGVNDIELDQIFPNRGRFGPSNLGFLG